MEIRKLVKSGNSSFTVALPLDWIKINDLKKGDKIFVRQKDNTLFIDARPKIKKKRDKEIAINIDGTEKYDIIGIIISTYMKPFKRLRLFGKEIPQKAKYIKELIYKLPALEVIEESSDRIIARSFLDYSDIAVQNILRRVDNICRGMFYDMLNMFDGEDIHESIVERDVEVNRLHFLAAKILKHTFRNPELARRLELKPTESLVLWELNVHLEKIGDEIKRISKLLAEGKRKIKGKEELKRLLKRLWKFYEMALKTYYKKDRDLCNKAHAERKKIVKLASHHAENYNTYYDTEIAGKVKGMASHLSDISRIVLYVY